MSLLDDIKRIKANNDHQRKKNPKNQKQTDLLSHHTTLTSLIPTTSKNPLASSTSKTFTNSQQNKSQTCSISSSALDKISASFANVMKNYSQENFKSEIEQKEEKLFFKGMVFCFGVRDLELSKKRIEVLQKVVKKRKGECVDIQNFEDFLRTNKQCNEIQCYVVSSLKKSVEFVRKQLPFLKQFEGHFHFLDYEYISVCEKMQQKINISAYLIEEQTSDKKEEKSIYKSKCSIVNSQPCKKVKPTFPSYQASQETISPQSQKESSQCSETLTIAQLQDYQNLTQIDEDPYEIKRISSVFQQKETETQLIDQKILTRTEKKKREKYQPQKEKFMCQTGSSKSQYWINQFICDELQKLQNIYQNGNDLGRKLAYMKAVSAIRSYHKQIESQKDITALRGIGTKITKKVRELLQTGKIQKLQKLQQGQQNISCCELSRVWGIGPNKAKQFYSKGIKTIQELRKNQDLLNKNQRVGLKYLKEFQVRIKRDKARRIYNFVCKKLHEITENHALHHIEICGSYRRGKQTCGDVDIIITRKDGKFQIALLLDLVCELEKCGFLTDHLSLPSRRKVDYNRPITYMGVCLLQDDQLDQSRYIHHRIDIKYYPLDQYAYALLYFTGSDMFNRSMRLYARRLGFTLSDRGMCLVDRSSKEKVKIGENVAAFSEEQIFTALGLDYKTPEQRNV